MSTKPARMKAPVASGRTRFGGIVAEFWMPMKPSTKAIVIMDGCPTVPSKRKVGEFFAKKGYWVFHPRYRGSWESDGEFLAESPEEDVLLVAEGINAGFVNVYDGIEYLLDVREIVVLGASFGGAAAVLSTKYPIVAKAIALAPVIDWKEPSEAEPFEFFLHMLEEGFGAAYRPAKDAWKKLAKGKFYSPKADAAMIDTSRLFVAHALDDRVVSVRPLREFSAKKKFRPLYLKRGGHFSTSSVLSPDIWPKVRDFLRS